MLDHPGWSGVDHENDVLDAISDAAEDYQLEGFDAAGPDVVDVDVVAGDAGVVHMSSESKKIVFVL